MADTTQPLTVNTQITDSVTQANTKVLGDIPAFATGNLMQVASQAAGLSMQNAVNNQQQTSMIHQATTTQGVSEIYDIPTAVNGQAVDTINRSGVEGKMVDALEIIKEIKS